MMGQGPEKSFFDAVEDTSLFFDSIEGVVPAAGTPAGDVGALFQAPQEALPLAEGHQLYEAGLLLNFKKDYDAAIEHLEKASIIYLQHKHSLGAIRCLIELAWLKYCHDESNGGSKSHRLFTEALRMINDHIHEPGVNETRARLLHYQGLVKYREKQFGEAMRNILHAKTFCNPDSFEAACILDSLSVHYERTSDYHRALQCLHQSLVIKHRLGKTYEQAVTLQILGRLYILREEYDKAWEHLSSALRVVEDIDDVKRVASLKNDLIRILVYQNELDRALHLIESSQNPAHSDKSLLVAGAMGLFYKAYIFYVRQNFEECQALLESKVLPVLRKLEYRKGYGMAYRLKACLLHQNKNGSQAIEMMGEVIGIFKELGEVAELAKTYFELGKMYLKLNENKLALASMLEALKVAELNGLSFLSSYIEDEIFRMDEAKWREIVDKRANHQSIFERDIDLMEAISSLEAHQPLQGGEANTPAKSLLSLLRVGQVMAAERDLDKLLQLIKDETELALSADRCTVFLYDRDRNELWSKVATGLDTTEEIRFPAHLGLAGYVAKTGEVLNIKDAYEDPRFNKEIDKKTGYVTRNILCLPMRNRRMEIIGVFQVLNKSTGHFDKVDEDLLTAIATSASVALENATLAQEMKVSFESFVKTLSSTIDARDPITAGHSERVAEYSLLIGEEMELERSDLEVLKYASLLHDIGKIGIREDILKKDGRLTEKEYRHIQKHVYYTYEILKNVHFERHLRTVPEIAAAHHEKMDGSGYFRGLKGSEIPLLGRILAISDVFDAITSRRHYRNRMSFDKVLEIMRRDAGTHFDADCVQSFFNVKLTRLASVLLDEYRESLHDGDVSILGKLDSQITIAEYYDILHKNKLTKGESVVHRTFSTIYHQTELCDLD